MYNVYLIQPQMKWKSIWLPYTIASLWTYLEQFQFVQKNFTVKDLIYTRDDIQNQLENIIDPDICLFSCYVWNWEYNNLLAQKIKQKYPNCIIVFGGPQIPEEWSKPHQNYIDSIVLHEGEINCMNLLQDILDDNLKSCYNKKHRSDLLTHPSPYIHNQLLQNIVDKEKSNVLVILETNRGCPFACTFCDWSGLIKSKIKTFNIDTVKKEIDWVSKNKIEYVYYADANFGALFNRDKEIAEYLATTSKKTGYPKYVNVNWYKNSREQVLEINEILASADLPRGINMSVQSMNKKTLQAINRDNMEVNDLQKMYKICNEKQLPFYTEFILGLPYETLESWTKGICEAIDLGCHYALDVYPYEVMPNAESFKTLDQYGMKTGKYNIINDSVAEYSDIVISTNTMTTHDIIEAWVWAWFIHTLHIKDITKQKFYKSKMSAFNFYSNLYKKLSTDALLNKPIEKARSRFTKAYQSLEINKDYILEIDDPQAVHFYKEKLYETINW